MLVVSLLTMVTTHQLAVEQLRIIAAHHQLAVARQLLRIIAAYQLVGQLLLLLIIAPLYLLHLQALTIPKIPRIWPTVSWPCITSSVLPLEFLRLYGASILPPAPRLGPTISLRQVSLPTTPIDRM